MNTHLLTLFSGLKFVPLSVQTVAVTALVNRMLRGQPLRMRLRELENRTVTIHITDIPWEMHFLIRDRRILRGEAAESNTVISGKLAGFIDLLGGEEDPDALFFQRRLNMEGDTETGVHVKNLLDSLEYDWDAHFDAVLVPALADRAKLWRRGIHKYFTRFRYEKR